MNTFTNNDFEEKNKQYSSEINTTSLYDPVVKNPIDYFSEFNTNQTSVSMKNQEEERQKTLVEIYNKFIKLLALLHYKQAHYL